MGHMLYELVKVELIFLGVLTVFDCTEQRLVLKIYFTDSWETPKLSRSSSDPFRGQNSFNNNTKTYAFFTVLNLY